MAGTVTVTRKTFYGPDKKMIIEKITAACVADSAAATYPSTAIPMFGRLVRVVTNPGATAPTDNYDISLGDDDDTALDVCGAALNNRDTATTEQLYPTVSSLPIYLAGSYTLAIANNAVNSAVIDVHFYLLQSGGE